MSTSLQKIPAGPHFAIIQTTSVYIPGDERSQTNPGHGYPASTEYFTTYTAYTTREEWVAQIEYLTLRKETFRAIEARPATIKTEVKIDVS